MSTVITMPSLIWFKTAKVEFVRSTIEMRSKYTGRRQIIVLPFALWQFEGQLIDMPPSEAAPWRSFLMRLKGKGNLFRLPVPGGSPVSGYGGANPTVNGAGQTGTTLSVTGASASTLILKDGDYFTVNDELKVAVADCTTNGSGVATITFEPSLRYSPPNGGTVNISVPTVLLNLSEDTVGWDLTKPVLHGISIKGTEAYE